MKSKLDSRRISQSRTEGAESKTGSIADALRVTLMEEYKNYFINGGGLFDWPRSSKFRAMSVVLKINPGGSTVVIKRFVDHQLFEDRKDAAAHALKRAKEWVDWAEETRAWVGMWVECFGWLA